MVSVRGTDKFVIGRIHQIPDRLNLSGNSIYKFFWRNPCLFCLQLDLLPMLVRAGLEEYIVPLASLISGDRIRKHDLIRVPNVRLPRCISNGCRNIVLLFIHF